MIIKILRGVVRQNDHTTFTNGGCDDRQATDDDTSCDDDVAAHNLVVDVVVPCRLLTYNMVMDVS